MSRTGLAEKENALQPPGLLVPTDSPFSAFLPSPRRSEKSKQLADPRTGPTVTPRKDSKSGGAVRAPLMPVSAVNGSNSPISHSPSAKPGIGTDSPRRKTITTASNSPLRSAEDIFSAFISSPPKQPLTPKTTTSEQDEAFNPRNSSKMDVSVQGFSSPKPVRSSVCFDALTRATSKTFEPITFPILQAPSKDAETSTSEINDSTYSVQNLPSISSRSPVSKRINFSHNSNAMEVDPTPVPVVKVDRKLETKRSVAGSPVMSEAVTAAIAITPTKSKRQLKHKEKSIKSSHRVNTEAPSQPSVSFAEPTSVACKSSPSNDESEDFSTKVVKGSPSRLAKGRLMNRPSYKVRTALVSVPPSNIMASQLKSNSITSSTTSDCRPASAGSSACASLTTPDTKHSSHLHTSISHKSGSMDVADTKSPISPVDPLSTSKTRGRSATLDETIHYGSFGGMIGGRMYDAYGFEEAPLRASVNPSTVMIPNPTQESFWTEWLSVTAAPASNLKSSGTIPQHAAVLSSMVLSGIPHGLRGRIWPQLLKVPLYRAEHSPVRGYYGELRSKGKHAKWGHQIDLDLHRTFCTHSHFKNEGRGQRQLSNVLNAYSHYNEKIGYCQGMSFLVGVLLMVMDEEERAFWTLCAMMDRDEGRLASYYEPGMSGVLRDVDVFRRMILLETPQLYSHLEKTGVDASFFCARWFLALFTDLSDWTTVLRIWDLFFLQGHLAIFRAALAILKASLSEILALKNAEHLFPFLLNLPFSKLNPSVIISLVRTIDVDYLYNEVTAPGAEEKYKVGHIDQPLPNNISKKSKRDGAAALHKAISKRKLQQLQRDRDEAKLKAEKERARAAAEAQPTTPLPRKSRPQSMMVFGSQSSSSGQHSRMEQDNDGDDSLSTPKSASKSFFGRMWDKLKSPSIGKSKPTPSKHESTPVPSTPTASIRTPSFASTTTTIPLSTHVSPSSPSRKASRRHVATSSATPAAPSPVRGTSKRFVKAMQTPSVDVDSKKQRDSPKRKRDFQDNEEENDMNSSPATKRYKVTSWISTDETECATAWEGGDELFMDQGEREAFIAFASSTPIRGLMGKSTPRPASVAVTRIEYTESHVSITPMRLPPPPGDERATPKVGGGPMRLAPVFGAETSHSSTGSAKTHHHGSTSKPSATNSALSPIEMSSTWISKK